MLYKQTKQRRIFGLSLCLITCVLFNLISPTVKASFVDVDVTHPYFHAIDALEEQGIIKGHQQGDIKYFRPLQEINRVEALKILLLGSDVSINSTGNSQFPDVAKNHWFHDVVLSAADRKIVSGFPDGQFRPDSKVTLAEFLKMLILSFNIHYTPAEDYQKWYTPFIKRAQELNIIGLDAEPSKTINRGEGAEMIFRSQVVQELDYQPYIFSGQGTASYYNEGFAGKLTASGEIYDPFDLTAAHRTLPFDTQIRIYNEDGKSVVVRVNDRGPYHEDRIIDLSQRAFETLAPISRGVLDIRFEIISDLNTESKRPTVPEHIRPKLSTGAQKPSVPDIVQDKIETNRVIDSGDPSGNPQSRSQKIFSETVTYLSKDFYPHLELREQIPKRLIQGTVFNISGRVIDGSRPSKVTVFVQNKENDEQQKFEAPVSGLNFNLPITFYDSGSFYLGIVFDDQSKSRVAEIEVESFLYPRKFPSSVNIASTQIGVNVVPEDEKVFFSWAIGENQISKLSFNQGPDFVKSLIFEDGIAYFGVDYNFFEAFDPDKNLAIDLYIAESQDESLVKQSSAWEKVDFSNYLLWEGFPDSEVEDISIPSFPRFLRSPVPFTIEGKTLSTDISLRNKAYLTKPNGFVKELPLNKRGIDQFDIRINPEETGTHIFEIIGEDGSVLFNRAIYINKDVILPILPWNYVRTTTESPAGVRNWINKIRTEHGRSTLNKSVELDLFAQNYAKRMATENFISHVDPDGNGFEARVFEADLPGEEFGENVSYGTTFDLALEGLETSGSHRKNVLEYKWKKVGVGAFQDSKGDWYVAQVFGN